MLGSKTHREACSTPASSQPLGSDHRGELGSQHLQRDLSLVLQVLSEVDRGHAALAQLALDAVLAAQCSVQAVGVSLVVHARPPSRPQEYTGLGLCTTRRQNRGRFAGLLANLFIEPATSSRSTLSSWTERSNSGGKRPIAAPKAPWS